MQRPCEIAGVDIAIRGTGAITAQALVIGSMWNSCTIIKFPYLFCIANEVGALLVDEIDK